MKLPICQTKVLDLNKIIIKLNAENKNLLMANSISKEKREELVIKYKETTDKNTALMVMI